MTTRRKTYDAAFREESVRLVLSSDRPVKQIAQEIGVKESTLGNWVHKSRDKQPDTPAQPEDRGPVAWDEHQKALAENARLKAEVEFLGKSQRLLCREAKVEDFYEFIEAEKANHPVVWLCRKLNVSRASYYRWRKPAGPSPRTVRHGELVTAVTKLYTKESGRAGRDQLTRLLNAAGTKVSAPTVGAIMREHGLRAIRTQAWKKTTLQDPQAKTAHIQNHMLDDQGRRDFTSAVPGTRLVGDITYLRTGEGWLYLATVIDLFSGMVIGWAMAEHMRASLCTAALRMARNHGHLIGGPVVFHSDRSTQYTSEEFQRWCAQNEVTQSMGKVGVCWDNAVAENFFSHLKTEFYHHHRFGSRLTARTAVMDYIEGWYNRRRPNRRAGGIPPATAHANHHTSVQEPLAA
ncbi:IS3 family transposase [Arthrobacter sp. KNU-44]|uniref:IS3 family transposase n=1 Tax=Arthrobacter sp. KNU-44 TaxID=3450744 RepID=UPI003F44356D